jgi:hypothetical protein
MSTNAPKVHLLYFHDQTVCQIENVCADPSVTAVVTEVTCRNCLLLVRRTPKAGKKVHLLRDGQSVCNVENGCLDPVTTAAVADVTCETCLKLFRGRHGQPQGKRAGSSAGFVPRDERKRRTMKVGKRRR